MEDFIVCNSIGLLYLQLMFLSLFGLNLYLGNFINALLFFFFFKHLSFNKLKGNILYLKMTYNTLK